MLITPEDEDPEDEEDTFWKFLIILIASTILAIILCVAFKLGV